MPAKFDRMRKGIKKSLSTQFPKMKDDELERRSFAIATKRWQDTHGGKNPMEEEQSKQEIKEDKKIKRDEQGRIIVAENVPIIFEADIAFTKEQNDK